MPLRQADDNYILVPSAWYIANGGEEVLQIRNQSEPFKQSKDQFLARPIQNFE